MTWPNDRDLKLRPYDASDREALLTLADNPKIARFMSNRFPYPYRPEDADAWLEFALGPGRSSNFAVEWSGLFIGGMRLDPMSDVHSGTAAVGYWLGEPYWGRGLGVRALKLLADHAFAEYALIRLQALAYADNHRSIRVLEKSGFEREGIMRRHVTKNGIVTDAVLYARLR